MLHELSALEAVAAAAWFSPPKLRALLRKAKRFAQPMKVRRVEPVEGSKMHLMPPSPDRAAKRSLTPGGFSRAFFEANP